MRGKQNARLIDTLLGVYYEGRKHIMRNAGNIMRGFFREVDLPKKLILSSRTPGSVPMLKIIKSGRSIMREL